MQNLILTVHIIVCVLLVILVLLQSGKEGMGVIFGGGNSSVFGSTGAGGILAKLTALMGVIFVITSLSYTYVTSSRTTSESVILKVKIEDDPPSPAVENASPKPEAGSETPAPTQSPAGISGAAEPPADSQPTAETPKDAGMVKPEEKGAGESVQPATDSSGKD